MQVQWTQGATQPGSSGAALIDADTRKVVGVLTGGTTSCSIFSGSDYFGKLSVVSQKPCAWEALCVESEPHAWEALCGESENACMCCFALHMPDWQHALPGVISQQVAPQAIPSSYGCLL